MKTGMATSAYANYPIRDAIQQIAKAGYDCIDIWGGRPHIYRKDFPSGELKDLRNEIEGTGMKVSSFMPAFYRYPHNLCSPNPRVWIDSLDYVFQSLDNAALLGSPILLVCPARMLVGQEIKSAWEQLVNSLRMICDRSSQYGIKIVLEPVNKNVFDLVNNVADAIRVINEVNKENLGLILDTGHLHLSDETINQALNTVGNRLFQVHVNDNDGQKQQNLIPGEGTFNFNEFFSGLKQIGYDGVVSAELTGDYGERLQAKVEETASKLKAWLKE